MRLARIALIALLGMALVSAVACSSVSSEYHLQTQIIEGQGEIYPSSGIDYYPAGTQITVVAVPDDGWEFSHFNQANKDWDTGVESLYSNPTIVTLDRDTYVGVVFTEISSVDVSYGKPCKGDSFNGIYGTDGECYVCPSSCSAPAGAENTSGEGFLIGIGVCCYWVNCSPYECQITE